MTPSIEPPPAEEWDFRGIDEWEFLPATIYEFVRSHPVWKPRLDCWLNSNFGERWRSVTQYFPDYLCLLPEWESWTVRNALRAAQVGDRALREGGPFIVDQRPSFAAFRHFMVPTIGYSVHPLFELAAVRLFEFPTPWMKLTAKPDRTVWDKFLTKPPAVKIEDGFDDTSFHRAMGRLIVDVDGPISSIRIHLEVSVDRYQGKRAVRDTFAELVSDYLIKPKDGESRTGRSSRFGYLKWLAAYRLAGLRFEAAKKLMRKRQAEAPRESNDLLPIYDRSQKWKRSVERVTAMVQDPGDSWLDAIGRNFL